MDRRKEKTLNLVTVIFIKIFSTPCYKLGWVLSMNNSHYIPTYSAINTNIKFDKTECHLFN